mmetsp:Transcript_4380/g.17221  ORF Transcript_4380/g.17221 Transcript_4380/m.17221 type:complete len:230 (-) Transcript_4380:146-835(-)
MGGREVLHGDLLRLLVGVQGFGTGLLPPIISLELGEISMVVALHLEIEHLPFLRRGVRDKVVPDDAENVLADVLQLRLDLLLVLLHLCAGVRLCLGLDAGDDTPRCTSSPNDILVRNRKEVALFDRQLHRHNCHVLHVLHLRAEGEIRKSDAEFCSTTGACRRPRAAKGRANGRQLVRRCWPRHAAEPLLTGAAPLRSEGPYATSQRGSGLLQRTISSKRSACSASLAM